MGAPALPPQGPPLVPSSSTCPEGSCQPRLSQVGSVVLCCHLVAYGEKAGQSTAWVEGCIPDLGRSRDARWVGQGRHSGI